jgi:hypothetical protein
MGSALAKLLNDFRLCVASRSIRFHLIEILAEGRDAVVHHEATLGFRFATWDACTLLFAVRGTGAGLSRCDFVCATVIQDM